jgi:Protein of unknown function (DUF4054)
MSTKQDITLHQGENWKITFAAHYADGNTMPLGSGSDVQFRIADSEGTVRIDLDVGNGVAVIDEEGGIAEITVTADDQEHSQITAADLLFYEIRVTKDNENYPQAEGRLTVSRSLFADAVDPLLLQFRARFSEFTEDDNVLSLYLSDATRAIDKLKIFDTSDHPLAVMLLAAHMVQMRYNAAQSRAGETGPISSIRVEDRSVSYSDANAGMSKIGLNASYYGKQYLALLRSYPQWTLRT